MMGISDEKVVLSTVEHETSHGLFPIISQGNY